MTDDNWKLNAACDIRRDGDLWYAPVDETAPARNLRVSAAKRICGGCPVAQECAIESANERHGIWAGVNVARPDADPEKPDTSRKPHTEQARALIAEATRATAARKFNDFVERITVLHRSSLTYDEILTELSISNAVLRQRLSRHDRLDLYSMLTGAAA